MRPGNRAARRYLPLYAMLALPCAYFILFRYVPMAGNILAFRRFKPLTGPYGVEWVGLKYFRQFLDQPEFWRAFRNTLVLSAINLLINFPLPILFALVLNETRFPRLKRLTQTVSYLPRFVSAVVMISILAQLLSPSGGPLNALFQRVFRLPPIYYLNEARYFRAIYVLTDAWQFTGWTAIIYLAAIAGIDPGLYDAARMDGAGRLGRIIHVTVPSILPTVTVMLILSVGRLLSLGFEKALLLYTPANAVVSDILDTYVYRLGFQSSVSQYSYAAAVGLFGGVTGLILVASANLLSRRLTGESVY